jgi:hypothetical protein
MPLEMLVAFAVIISPTFILTLLEAGRLWKRFLEHNWHVKPTAKGRSTAAAHITSSFKVF